MNNPILKEILLFITYNKLVNNQMNLVKLILIEKQIS